MSTADRLGAQAGCLQPASPSAPSVSVIINTVDRARSLAALLAALEQQAYPCFEVIVVVGPTRDDTLELLAGYAQRLRVLRCARANLGESRNVGLLAARGDIVAFIDDDAVPCRTWLAQLAAAFTHPAVAAVGGSVYLVHPAQPAIQHRLGIVSGLGEHTNVRGGAIGGPPVGAGIFWSERPMGTNMAFRRAALLAAGGFDAYYAWVYDDADVALRLALAGYTVRGLLAAPVYHVPASSRNRVVRTFTGRWWIGTQAAAYFAVQNGRASGHRAGAILLHVLQLAHGVWLLSGELHRDGKISRRALWSRRWRGTLAALHGALDGLGRRHLVAEPPAPAAARQSAAGEAANA
jgi:glycosyltransferase involved in cell wall biosynthesis